MKKPSTRRKFIQRLGALFSTALVSGRIGFGSNKTIAMQVSLVNNIEPLGFQWKARDPFLFCVHHEDFFPKGQANMGPNPKELEGRDIGQDFMLKDGWRMYHGKTIPGFPVHPHRGFETVTVVRRGMVDHTDSMGAAGRYGNGDVQWMTAGKGIQHAEMFPLIHRDKENPMELFQIWVNLPRASKFVEPHFKMLWGESIPKYEHSDEQSRKTRVEVIAGKLGAEKAPSPPPDSWAANEEHDVAIWNIHMEAGASWTLPAAPPHTNRNLYFYKGDKLLIDGEELEHYHMAELQAGMDVQLESGKEECQILILQGKPIAEPVVQYGPFVMNTRQEIQEAFDDYQKTQFGGWPWSENDPLHPAGKGRFALHADGREEIK